MKIINLKTLSKKSFLFLFLILAFILVDNANSISFAQMTASEIITSRPCPAAPAEPILNQHSGDNYVEWNNVTCADYYNIYFNGVFSTTTTATNTSFYTSDYNPTEPVDYVAGIQSVNQHGVSSIVSKNMTNVTYEPCPGVNPDTPVINSATSFSFSWTKTACTYTYWVFLNATSYNLNTYYDYTFDNNYTFTNLSPNTNYEFGVMAVSASRESSVATTNLNTGNFDPCANAVMTTPDIFGVSSSQNYVNFNWSSIPCVSHYNVYLNSNLATSTTNQNYSFYGLDPQTTYTISVQAIGKTTQSQILSFDEVTLADPCYNVLPDQASLSGWMMGINSIDITLNSSSCSDYYNIYVDNNLVASTTDQVYTISGLSPNTTYNIGVSTVNNFGESEIVSQQITTNVDPCENQPPQLESNYFSVNYSNISTSSLAFGWGSANCADSYNIYLDGNLISNTTNLNYQIDNLNPDTNYHIGVQAVNANGTSDYYSDPIDTLNESNSLFTLNNNIWNKVENTDTDTDIYWSSIATSVDGSKAYIVTSSESSTENQSGNIYKSLDNGKTWSKISGTNNHGWKSIASSADGTKLAAISTYTFDDQSNNIPDGIYVSIDSGDTWTKTSAQDSYGWQSITSSADGTKLAAVDMGGYIYTSSDSGDTWIRQENSVQNGWTSITSSADGTKLAAVSYGIYDEESSLYINDSIYTSNDSGVTWNKVPGSNGHDWYSISSSADGKTLVAVSDASYINNTYIPGDNIFISTDGGANWGKVLGSNRIIWSSVSVSADGKEIVASSEGYYNGNGDINTDNLLEIGGVFTSIDGGSSWTKDPNTSGIYSLISISNDGSKAFAGSYHYTGEGYQGSLYYGVVDLPKPIVVDTPDPGGDNGGVVLPVAFYNTNNTITNYNTTNNTTQSSYINNTESIFNFTKTLTFNSKLNDVNEVKEWQKFLNKELNINLPITGYFGQLTLWAVRSFQTKYADDILKPLNLTRATGNIGEMTIAKANQILNSSK